MVFTILASLVAVLHVLFGLAESVGWTAMAKRFGYKRDQIEATRTLALNQGAYNAGVAAIIGWGLFSGNTQTVVAMLAYVVAMAIVGALSVRWTIFVIQGLPAVAALASFFVQ